MSSGKEHDQSTSLWVLPFSICLGLLFDLQSGLLGAVGFIFGGYWFSPDLDTHSNCLKRWGIIRFIWWPYRKTIRHRSFFSHGPLIGTLVRVLYLFTLIYLLAQSLNILNQKEIFIFKDLINFLIDHTKESTFIILGIEASAWLHLIKDGDPLPAEWSQKRRK